MAMGKVRPSKRSSGVSYTSTLTTIAFIALCVLGVWMMSSNSDIPSNQSTARTTTDIEDTGAGTSIDTTTAISTDTDADAAATTTGEDSNTSDKKNLPVYEDKSGVLPDGTVKSDSKETNAKENSQQAQEEALAESMKNSATQKSSNEATHEAEILDIKDKQELLEQQNGAAETQQQGFGQNSRDETRNVEENVPKKLDLVVEENKQKEEMKENAQDTQVSEESSVTQKQEVDERRTDQETKPEVSTQDFDGTRNGQQAGEDQEGGGKQDNQEEAPRNIEPDHHESLQDHQQKMPHQRLKKGKRQKHKHQHQTQQKEQSRAKNQEGTSHDQTEHDEAIPLQFQAHDSEAQAEIQQTKRDESNLNTEANEKQRANPSSSDDSFSGGEGSGIPKESKESKKSWSTQADESQNEKKRRKHGKNGQDGSNDGYTWQLCNVTAGTDYIPCLDNVEALRKLHTTKHFEHRERHCPEEAPTCLVRLPSGYKQPVEWPQSRDKIWYHNVPHTKLAEVKGHQNWVKVTGEFLTFPGGGTQFIHGAPHYIDFVQEAGADIAWGQHTRVILDVGCGVASFGGYLFDRDVLAMSFAPKDEHEAQIQFALERGIPAISAVMGSQRLPFPSRVFDLVHCARCRVPWHADGGSLLLELNRVLRPGGLFVWSATPVYQALQEDVEIWETMTALTKSMCWELVAIKKDKLNSIGAAFYQKPVSNECYEQRQENQPPMCKSEDDPNAAWYVPLQSCMHHVPVDENERGSKWPEKWPRRLLTPPYWLNKSQKGIYGKPAPDDFAADYEHWKGMVSKTYLSGLGISWKNVRNIMDMRAVYGGFAAALKDLKVWVMNVVNIDSPDTLPIIYERGLFGIYHDWCESFSTYPRSYDLLHADGIFSRLKKRCKILPTVVEVDRIVRPGGKLIVRDDSSTIKEVEEMLKSLHWEVRVTSFKDQEDILSAQKGDWRPDSYAASS